MIDQHLDDRSVSFEAELRPLLGVAMRLATALRLERNDAEDAVQEAALRAWRSRRNRRPGTDLRPWFLAIVANQCRETCRGRWASVLRFADPPERATVAAIDATGSLDMATALPLKGYVNLQGMIGGRVVQLGVTHSAGGPLLNNNNGTLPMVRLLLLRPGGTAYVAFEDSDVPNGPTPCSSTQTLLITPPQGGHPVSLTGTPVSLCGGFRAKLWIDIAPVSGTPYYNTKIA